MSARASRRLHAPRPFAAFCFAAATGLVASTTSAQQLVPAIGGRGIQIGLRVGYGIPFGKSGRTVSDLIDGELSRSIKRQVPIGVDVGYRITPHVDVGLLLQYGFGLIGSSGDGNCNQPGVSCSSSDLVLGAGARFHLSPTAWFDPWLGLGFGYERLDVSIDSGDQTFSASASGFEYLDVQLGGDARVAPNVAVGPFVGFAIGQYRTGTYVSVVQQRGSSSLSHEIADKPFHEWLLLGLRGVYDIRR